MHAHGDGDGGAMKEHAHNLTAETAILRLAWYMHSAVQKRRIILIECIFSRVPVHRSHPSLCSS